MFDNYDDYLDGLEPLPGTSQTVRDENAERRKEKRKFEVSEEMFVYLIENTISASLVKEMENDEVYVDIRSRNSSREYWEYIRNIIKTKNKDEILANKLQLLYENDNPNQETAVIANLQRNDPGCRIGYPRITENGNSNGEFVKSKRKIVDRDVLQEIKQNSNQYLLPPTVPFPTLLKPLDMVLAEQDYQVVIDVEQYCTNYK